MTILDDVESIGRYAFRNSENLREVKFESNSNSTWTAIGGGVPHDIDVGDSYRNADWLAGRKPGGYIEYDWYKNWK